MSEQASDFAVKGQYGSGLNPELDSSVIFQGANRAEILRLDKDGFVFKGQRIEDAGEAHRAWMEAMQTIQRAPALERDRLRAERSILIAELDRLTLNAVCCNDDHARLVAEIKRLRAQISADSPLTPLKNGVTAI